MSNQLILNGFGGDAHHDISTDGWIKRVVEYWREHEVSRDLICWLIEPRGLRPENYQIVDENASLFSTILTYDKELIEKYPNKAKFYPLGGSSIAFYKWGLYPKTKDICMILSDKKTTEGHKLRHKIAEEFGDRIDLYGAGVGKPFDSKFEVLKDYRYAIVVESCRQDFYVSEKLIDALSVGCIVFYWGCPEIGKNWTTGNRQNDKFGFYGVYPFSQLYSTPDGKPGLLGHINYHLIKIHENIYEGYAESDFEKNLEIIKSYRITEDWIFEHYSDLFI